MRFPRLVSTAEAAVMCVGAALCFLYAWTLDDAYIYYRYVDNLLFLDAGLPFGGVGHESSLEVRARAVSAPGTFAAAQLVRLEVRVTWADHGVRDRTVHLERFIANSAS